ncbi:MAG: chemotaxis protein CheB [Pirellula sp.]
MILTRLPSFVVGIGASAGGLESLEKLFQNLPDDTGMAFVFCLILSVMSSTVS